MVGVGRIGLPAIPLYLIAGYFTPRAYDRKEARGFVVDRLKRLAVPWLLYEKW